MGNKLTTVNLEPSKSFFFLAIPVMIHGTMPNMASLVGLREIASPNWSMYSARRTESAAWK